MAPNTSSCQDPRSEPLVLSLRWPIREKIKNKSGYCNQLYALTRWNFLASEKFFGTRQMASKINFSFTNKSAESQKSDALCCLFLFFFFLLKVKLASSTERNVSVDVIIIWFHHLVFVLALCKLNARLWENFFFWCCCWKSRFSSNFDFMF